MRDRRFLLLAAGLVALNLVLWLAPAGLALRNNVLARFFGPKLVRAEVVVSHGGGSGTADWHVDRGVITSATATQLGLTELDGRIQQIDIAPSTQVLAPRGRRVTTSALATGWRVLVIWQDSHAAKTVQMEKRPPQAHGAHGGAKKAARSAP